MLTRDYFARGLLIYLQKEDVTGIRRRFCNYSEIFLFKKQVKNCINGLIINYLRFIFKKNG